MPAKKVSDETLHDFYIRYQEAGWGPPSGREVCEALGFTTNALHDRLVRLEKVGIFERHPSASSRARNWRAI